jgi:hypothetical protein
MESRTAQQSENILRRNDEKTRGDEIRLLAYFPESKPFWDENFHKLQCFACDFSQETKRNCDEPIQQMNWMTKRIKKGNLTHIVALCPQCTSGDPWTIHGPTEYTLLRIDTTGKQETLSQQTKRRTSEGWPNRPTKVKFYKNDWSMGDMYDRPIDWSEQADDYKRKMDIYKEKREEYDAFYEEKLKEIPEIKTPTSEEGIREEQLRKRKVN